MSKTNIIIFLIFIAFIIGAWFFQSAKEVLDGAKPAVLPPSGDVTEEISGKENPFSLPEGFSIEVFEENVPGARDITLGPNGNLVVSQTKEGIISSVRTQNRDTYATKSIVLSGLNNPHGIAYDPDNRFMLYIAEENKISRVDPLSEGAPLPEKIADLPSGGQHTTRTIGFGPDGKLYVSIGSTCDVCEEKNEERGAIIRMNKDGGDRETFATGLRNTVFFTWSLANGSMWATEMGRDWLGDDLPPDEINVIKEGGWYGWPWFYGANVRDEAYKPEAAPQFAKEPIASTVDIPAHSAPLGLAFIPEEGWPEEMQGDLLVAYHGSWNRTEPAGYKIVRMKIDENGEYIGTEDFITGWITNEKVFGRPVDILVLPDGVMYITDDKAGVVYKVTYNPQLPAADEIQSEE